MTITTHKYFKRKIRIHFQMNLIIHIEFIDDPNQAIKPSNEHSDNRLLNLRHVKCIKSFRHRCQKLRKSEMYSSPQKEEDFEFVGAINFLALDVR